MLDRDLQYPIGTFEAPEEITRDHILAWIERIRTLPQRLAAATASLPSGKLEAPYRSGGWTRREVLHHVADSHMNSLVRFKWALTEQTPTIKAYDEAAWAKLSDYRDVPVDTSLRFLAALHERWVPLLESLTTEHLSRTFVHPESGDTIGLAENIGIYAWHGDHHLAHVLLP